MRRRSIGLFLVALVLVAAPSHASTIYTGLPEFLAHVQPGYYLETFNSITLGDLPPTMTFSSGGYSYVASAPSDLWGQYAPGSSTDVVLSNNTATDPITFTFTSGNVNAVGGYFFGSDIGGNLLAADVVLTLSDGTVYTIAGATPGSFAGFITNPGVWITSLVVDAPDSPPVYVWPTVNDLYTGSAAVPEPATVLLLAGGLIATAAHRRRNR